LKIILKIARNSRHLENGFKKLPQVPKMPRKRPYGNAALRWNSCWKLKRSSGRGGFVELMAKV
jgi:hypothetical protein